MPVYFQPLFNMQNTSTNNFNYPWPTIPVIFSSTTGLTLYNMITNAGTQYVPNFGTGAVLYKAQHGCLTIKSAVYMTNGQIALSTATFFSKIPRKHHQAANYTRLIPPSRPAGATKK